MYIQVTATFAEKVVLNDYDEKYFSQANRRLGFHEEWYSEGALCGQ